MGNVEDLRAEGFVEDPYPTYARLREKGPVHRVRIADDEETWLVVGHEAARAALADPRLAKDFRKISPDVDFTPGNANMLNADPPEHTRLRRLVAREFTPAGSPPCSPGCSRSPTSCWTPRWANPPPTWSTRWPSRCR